MAKSISIIAQNYLDIKKNYWIRHFGKLDPVQTPQSYHLKYSGIIQRKKMDPASRPGGTSQNFDLHRISGSLLNSGLYQNSGLYCLSRK